MKFDMQKNWPILLAGALVVVAIYAATNAPANPTSTGYSVIPGQDNSAQQNQANQLNAQVAAQYSQGLFSAFSTLAGTASTLYNDQATVALQRSKDQLAQFQTIEQARVAINQSDNQLAAAQTQAHVQQQHDFWGSLFGGIGSVAKLIPLSAHPAVTQTSVPQGPATNLPVLV